jgi:hypothetical protein
MMMDHAVGRLDPSQFYAFRIPKTSSGMISVLAGEIPCARAKIPCSAEMIPSSIA